MHNEQAVTQFAERYAAAWCSQNPASVAAFYDEKGSLSVNKDAPAVGREAIANLVEKFMKAFPNMKVVMNDLRLEEEAAVFHWTLTGTNSGPGGTGRSVRIKGFEVWTLGDDGLITRSRGTFDADDYLQQLGT